MLNWLKSLFVSAPLDPAALQSAAKQIETLISSNKVVAFSKSYCPYCTTAKSILAKAGAGAIVLELDQIANGSAIQNALAVRAGVGRVTVPQIFINEKLIGGCSDIQALGQFKLAELLA